MLNRLKQIIAVEFSAPMVLNGIFIWCMLSGIVVGIEVIVFIGYMIWRMVW